MNSHIPHPSLHHARHIGLLIVVATPPVEVEQEAHHKISFQYYAAHVFHVDLVYGPGNTLILVQYIIN